MRNTSGKRMRCGRCAPCLAEDCGQCTHCLRKKKFGGEGTSRQPCVLRRCVVIHGYVEEEQQRTGGPKPTPLTVPSVSQRKEPPNPPHSRVLRGSVPDGPGRQGDPESSSDTNGKGSGSLLRKRPQKRAFPALSQLEMSLLPAKEEESTKAHAMGTGVKKNYRRVFGRKLPPPPRIGVCAVCGDDSKTETVLLCDGQDCEREYYLSCAKLKEVPSGDWFCVDCHPKGSGAEALANYLELMDDTRSDYAQSKSFVQALLSGDLVETNPRVPVSEVEKAQMSSRIHSAAALIGKPIWIRIPTTGSQVPGRIVDHRRVEISEAGEVEDVFLVRFAAGHYDRKETLYHWIYLEEHQLMVGDRLVLARKSVTSRLQPGVVYLRTSRELVASNDNIKRAMLNCRRLSDSSVSHPAISTTSAKLPPSSTRSRHKLKQDRTKSQEVNDSSASAHMEGDEQSVLVGFFGQVGEHKFHVLYGGGRHSTGDPEDLDKTSSRLVVDLFDPDGALTTERMNEEEKKELKWPELAAALVEHEEQKNVLEWQLIPPGRNPFHPEALKSRDYFSLTPLIPDDDVGDDRNREARLGASYTARGPTSTENAGMEALSIDGELHTRLCPLIMTGIDPLHVMKILHRNHPKDELLQPSKELAASFSCSIVPYKWPGEPETDERPELCHSNIVEPKNRRKIVI